MIEERLLVEEQHAIPQQISAFQFRLVGDMTLQQFLQVGGGAVIALLIYASGLPNIIRWPLILFSFGVGAALAFLPLEDRPLGKWIYSFFKSIYSPTIFVWRKTAQQKLYFAPETEVPKKERPDVVGQARQVLTPPATVIQKPEEKRLEEKEQVFLQNITTIYDASTPQTTVISGVPPVISQPQPLPDAKPFPKKDKAQVTVPKEGTVAVSQGKKDRGFQLPQDPSTKPFTTTSVSPVLGKGYKIVSKKAQFSQEASPPSPPTRPNTMVGQVMNPEGKIVEGAILEIKDAQGRAVRALKTNKLGHFRIVTPLLSGKYEITTEKEGLIFEPVSFSAEGKVIPPIAIWAKEKGTLVN